MRCLRRRSLNPNASMSSTKLNGGSKITMDGRAIDRNIGLVQTAPVKLTRISRANLCITDRGTICDQLLSPDLT